MKIKVPLMFCFPLLAGLTMCHARVQAQSKPEPYSKKKTPPVFAILPDLVIRSANRVEPNSTKVLISIANIGKADAGYFEVSYACDWYPKEEGKTYFLAGAVLAVESLTAGESKPFEVNCPRNIPSATKIKFGATADWSKKIKESKETNNTYSDPDLK